MKKSTVIDRQIYCTVRKDLFRLTLDIDGEYTKTTGSIHPSTVLFRGEQEILDYQVVNQYYVTILLP